MVRSAPSRSSSHSSRAPTARTRERAYRAPRGRTWMNTAPSSISSIGCTRCGNRPPGTPGSRISAITSSRPSSASTTRPTIARDSTRRSSAPRRPPSRACSSIAASELGVDVLRPWDLAVDAAPRRADSPVRDVGRVRGHRRQGLRARGPASSADISDDDRRSACWTSRAGRARRPADTARRSTIAGRPFIFMNAVGVVDDVMHAAPRSGSRLPRLRLARASRSSGSGTPAPRPPSSRRCRWSSWRRRTGEADRLLRREGSRRAWLEHLEDVLLSLVAHRDGGRVPELDLHQRRGRRPRRARQRMAPDPHALRARRRLGGSSRSDCAVVPPAPHLSSIRSTTSSTASPRSVRSRCGATASATGGRRGALPEGARARRGARAPEMYRAAGADAQLRRGAASASCGAGGGAHRAAPRATRRVARDRPPPALTALPGQQRDRAPAARRCGVQADVPGRSIRGRETGAGTLPLGTGPGRCAVGSGEVPDPTAMGDGDLADPAVASRPPLGKIPPRPTRPSAGIRAHPVERPGWRKKKESRWKGW